MQEIWKKYVSSFTGNVSPAEFHERAAGRLFTHLIPSHPNQTATTYQVTWACNLLGIGRVGMGKVAWKAGKP